MMSKIIGLLLGRQEIDQEIENLVNKGMVVKDICVLTQEKEIKEALGCDPICTVRNHAISGALLVGGIYSVFGLFAGWCECNLLDLNQSFGILTLLGGILAGCFVGGILGAIIGFAESEQDSHLYLQGSRLGNQVILMEVTPTKANETKQILRQAGFTGIKTIAWD